MNILTNRDTLLVCLFSNNQIEPKDGQWAVDGIKTGIKTSDAVVSFAETDPPFLILNAYKYSAGVWTVGDQAEFDFQFSTLTNEKSKQMRQGRDQLLKDTDWTQSSDLPQTFRTPWATYRQALRDLPNSPGFPWIDFPPVPVIGPPTDSASTGLVNV
jgi:hypothetical protein